MSNKPRARADDPPGIDMAPVRAEERDVWARAGRVYEHYKLAWAFWIVFATSLAWGIKNIYEPLATVPALQAQVARQDTVTRANFDTVKSRLDAAEVDRRDMAQILKIFGKVLCASTDPLDRYKYDIKCSDLPAPLPKAKAGI